MGALNNALFFLIVKQYINAIFLDSFPNRFQDLRKRYFHELSFLLIFFFFLLIIIIIIFEPIFNLLNHILFKSSKKKRVKVVIKSQIFMSKEIK